MTDDEKEIKRLLKIDCLTKNFCMQMDRQRKIKRWLHHGLIFVAILLITYFLSGQ